MRFGPLWAITLSASLAASACRAEDVRPAGDMPIDLSLWTVEQVSADTVLVQVSASTRSEQGIAVARIKLSSSMTLLTGDTAFTVPVRRVLPPRTLKLHVPRGTHEIRATAVAGEPGRNADLVEARLLIIITSDSVQASTSEILRAESTIEGQRYRYAGFWLVPLGADEDFSVAEFARAGTKPKPVSPITARCSSCPASVDTVTFVAVITRAGKVVQARPLGAMSPLLAKAAGDALAKARFEPAKYHDTLITDWTHVRVAVVRD